MNLNEELHRVKEIMNIDDRTPQRFTEEDLDHCWRHYKTYLVDILNGEYDLNDARNDLKGLIGSKYDTRVSNNT